MDLSQQELPITTYFSRGKHEKTSTKKRKLPDYKQHKREKRAVVSPNARTGSQEGAKQAKKPTSLPHRQSDDVVILDSPPNRPVASRSRSAKIVAHTHVPSTASQSLATPPRTNQPKKRKITIAAALGSLPPKSILTTIAPLPTPETTMRKPCNIHVPSGLRTLIGATSPCRIKRRSDNRVPLSPSQASVPLMMKFTVPIHDDHFNTHSRKHLGGSTVMDPDDPFTSMAGGNGVHVTIPVSSPVLPSKDLPSDFCSNIVQELVPSSQSQYLLALDSTPSRKRVAKPVRIKHCEPVSSSQSQEEREIGVPPLPGNVFHKLSFTARLEVDLTTPRPIQHVVHCDRSERQRLHHFTLASSPATSPVGSPSKEYSRSFLETKSPRNRTSFVASPSRSPLKRTPRRVGYKTHPVGKSMRPPDQEDDSVTEPESEPDVLKPGEDDGSETEPESEFSMVKIPAGTGKCQPQDVSKWSRAIPPKASIPHSASFKRSPYKKGRKPNSLYTSSLDDLMQEGAGMSVPESDRHFMLPSSVPPAEVKDFLDMFQGEGSYPEDFPESLRC